MRIVHALTVLVCMGLVAPTNGQTQYRYRLLIAYTQNYANSEANPLLQFDDNVVNYINGILHPNSQIANIQAEIVCVWNSHYTETGNYNTDMTRLLTPGDGFFDDILGPNGLRNTYRADIVCLATCGGGTWYGASCTGVAFGIDPAIDNAFLIYQAPPFVVANEPRANLPHEIGHVFGAQHQNISSIPYTFASAYSYTGGQNYRTVMGSFNPWRDYYSSPLLQDLGQTIGVANISDVRRLIIGRMDDTEDYYNHDALCLYREAPASVTLANETVESQESRNMIATTSINVGDGFTVEQDGRFVANITTTPMGKHQSEPQAQPGEGLMSSEALSLRVGSHAEGITVRYTLPVEDQVSFRVLDMDGRQVSLMHTGMKEPGRHSQKLPVAGLSRGGYVVVLETSDHKSAQVFFRLP